VENAMRIVTSVITEADRRGATSVAVTEEANDRFFEFISERGKHTLMHGKACVNANSYYIDKHGDFGFLRPTTAYQSTRASKRIPMSDFEFRTVDRVPARRRRRGLAPVAASDGG